MSILSLPRATIAFFFDLFSLLRIELATSKLEALIIWSDRIVDYTSIPLEDRVLLIVTISQGNYLQSFFFRLSFGLALNLGKAVSFVLTLPYLLDLWIIQ